MSTTGAADLNALLVFAAVAEAASFTAAAEQLGQTKARVSLVVRRLETQLGATLFSRTTRRVAMTDAGQALYGQCVPALRGVQEVLEQLGGPAELRGNLRISASVDYAAHTLAPAVAAFSALHPQLDIELKTGDRVVDMLKEGIDVALRVGWLRDSSLRASRLDGFEQVLVASPAYLQRAAPIKTPADLAQHDWVTLTLLPTPLTWKFTSAGGQLRTVRMKSRLRTDSGSALRALLQNGSGISVMDQPSAMASLRSGELVQVLADWRLPSGGVYAVVPPGRHIAGKARAFVDFYSGWLRQRR